MTNRDEERERESSRWTSGEGWEGMAGPKRRSRGKRRGEETRTSRRGEGERWERWWGEREREREREIVGREAQACGWSRLESRRIPKRNTPLRPRHGSHASVSPDWPPVPNFPLRFLTRAHWTHAVRIRAKTSRGPPFSRPPTGSAAASNHAATYPDTA